MATVHSLADLGQLIPRKPRLMSAAAIGWGPHFPCFRCSKNVQWGEAVISRLGDGIGYGHPPEQCDPADVKRWQAYIARVTKPKNVS